MSEFALSGIAVALLSLVFSDFPFIQLVYFLGIQSVVDWTTFGVVTGFMILATYGANIYKRLKL